MSNEVGGVAFDGEIPVSKKSFNTWMKRFLCFLFGHDNIVWGAHFCGDGAIWTKCLRCGKRTETSV
jgi:hypothetical protein